MVTVAGRGFQKPRGPFLTKISYREVKVGRDENLLPAWDFVVHNFPQRGKIEERFFSNNSEYFSARGVGVFLFLVVRSSK
jgi:hypothetical protein